MARFAAALSEHPVTAHAVGEVIGQVMDRLPIPPSLACLFLTAAHAGALEDAAGAVQATLGPRALIGAAVEGLAAAGRQVGRAPAVALWVGTGFDCRAFSSGPRGDVSFEDAAAVSGPTPVDTDRLVVALGDGFGLDHDELLRGLGRRFPGAPVIGGLLCCGQGQGGNRLALGNRIRTDGAVGAVLDGLRGLRTTTAAGCRALGEPLVVTASEGSMVYEMGGRTALDRLMEVIESGLDRADAHSVNTGGLHLGVAIDQRPSRPGPGDFLVHRVLGADRSNGAVAASGEIPVGSLVQFQLRDPRAARQGVQELAAMGPLDSAMVFGGGPAGPGRASLFDLDPLWALWPHTPVVAVMPTVALGPVARVNRRLDATLAAALFDRSVPG